MYIYHPIVEDKQLVHRANCGSYEYKPSKSTLESNGLTKGENRVLTLSIYLLFALVICAIESEIINSSSTDQSLFSYQ